MKNGDKKMQFQYNYTHKFLYIKAYIIYNQIHFLQF